MQTLELPQTAAEIKSCCAALYESDWAPLLLGESFHPGGLVLTRRLGELLDLQPGQRVLDVASGNGNGAIHLAQEFGCEVVGVDYGNDMISKAKVRAQSAGVSAKVQFEQGDAEWLRFEDGVFDAIICECAFCTFPRKATAAAEFARVLRPGGMLGLSDLTRTGSLPAELDILMAWIACIADAQPLTIYTDYLAGAGLAVTHTESHQRALTDMVRDVQSKLLGAEIMIKLNKLSLPEEVDLDQAKNLARHAGRAIQKGELGYVLITGQKPRL